MSFTNDTKKELCNDGRRRERKECCTKALLHGMLLGCREYSDCKIELAVECEAVARHFASVIKSLYKYQPELSRQDAFGHRFFVVTVTDRPAVMQIHDDFDLFTDPYRLNESIVYCCNKCSASFLSGLFCASGHLGEPGGESRLEIPIRTQALCEDIEGLLSMISFPPTTSHRREKPVILYKKYDAVENFLGFIGADGAVLKLMEEKLIKDLRNETNRRSNFDTCGMNRAVNAGVGQAKMISELDEMGLLSLLDESSAQTASLRLRFPSISLTELAKLHDPPITKSGVNHRMEKIKELYEKYKK